MMKPPPKHNAAVNIARRGPPSSTQRPHTAAEAPRKKIAIEKIFNYPGLGLTIANAASKDPPVLVAGVLVVAVVYMLGTLSADLILAWMNPRATIGDSTDVIRAEPGGGG